MDQGLREDLLGWLERIRRSFQEEESVCLDFRETSYADANAMLVVVAEIERMKCLRPTFRVGALQARSLKIQQVMHRVGLSKHVDGLNRRIRIGHPQVAFWRSIRGHDNDTSEVGTLIHKLQAEQRYSDEFLASLNRALSEAITNAVVHAYQDLRGDDISSDHRGWWAFFGIQKDILNFVVCDLGMGIPRSIKTEPKHFVLKLWDRGVNPPDVSLIKLAFRAGKSSSAQRHRGQGMVDMKNFIETAKRGTLGVWSGNGVYAVSVDSQKEIEWQTKTPMLGTVVWWSIPVGEMRQTEPSQ